MAKDKRRATEDDLLQIIKVVGAWNLANALKSELKEQFGDEPQGRFDKALDEVVDSLKHVKDGFFDNYIMRGIDIYAQCEDVLRDAERFFGGMDKEDKNE